MTKNYNAFRQFSLLWAHFAFIDVPAYLADQLFIKHQVTVHFGEELHHPEANYIIIFCKVRKKDTDRFLAALEELPDKMLICGHLDYEEYCNDIIGRIEKYAA